MQAEWNQINECLVGCFLSSINKHLWGFRWWCGRDGCSQSPFIPIIIQLHCFPCPPPILYLVPNLLKKIANKINMRYEYDKKNLYNSFHMSHFHLFEKRVNGKNRYLINIKHNNKLRKIRKGKHFTLWWAWVTVGN